MTTAPNLPDIGIARLTRSVVFLYSSCVNHFGHIIIITEIQFCRYYGELVMAEEKPIK